MSRSRPKPPTPGGKPFRTENGFTVETNTSNDNNNKNKKQTP
ncbi:hypothetical protein NIES4071_77870 [Calothrix sp. NIES-4071]|nr:hypothetical protein NIES4071_77870 [Calothrix sp. NIES-4071]BAZ62060.1 hypothetical protein NIES4105_77810 [Calothrix sp. NIES-4105]